ncbi:MAG: DUF2848 family protein [Hyphomicrobiaceae bacterium]
MSRNLAFDLLGGGSVQIEPDDLLFAGFASRDPADAEHHRQELKEKGVVVPDTIPVCYRGLPSTLSQADVIETQGRPLMGEVEFVVVESPSGLLVSTGVDLFDEVLEQTDIEGSKNQSATPIGKAALRLAEVRNDWDSFKLWMRLDGRLVQEGSVAKMMEPERLLELAGAARGKADRALFVYSGSMPYIAPPSSGFTLVEFGLEGAGHRITHQFRLTR